MPDADDRPVAGLSDRLRAVAEHMGDFPLRAPSNLTTMVGEQVDVYARFEDSWWVGLRLDKHASGWNVIELSLVCTREDGPGLTSNMLRGMAFGALLDEARADARRLATSEVGDLPIDRLLNVWKGDARKTKARRDETAYAALAAKYVEYLSAGSRKPAAALAAELGISTVTASQRIREARQMGLLSGSQPGIPSGVLSEHALELLEQAAAQTSAEDVEGESSGIS